MTRLKDRWQGISLEGCVSVTTESTDRNNGNYSIVEKVSNHLDSPFHNWQPQASRISDDFDPWNPTGVYRRPRACDHIKLITGKPAGFTEFWQWGPYDNDSTFKFHGAPMDYLASSASKGMHCPPPPSNVVSPFAFQALKEMAEQFPEELDMINFLIDLKQLPAAIMSLKSIKDQLIGTRDGGAPWLKNLKKGLRNGDSIKAAARKHLEANFGWSPLLGDVSKIFTILHTVEKRLDWLRRNRNKSVRVGSRRSYSNSDELYLGSFGPRLGPKVRMYRTATQGDLYCTGYVRQNLPWLDEWWGWVRGVIGAGGMNRPLSVIWERIPFSWLVDYFVPVGNYLSSVVFQDIKDWEVRDVSWSFKSMYDHQLELFDQNGNFQKVVHRGRLQRYCRSVGFPPRSWYIEVPSWKEISLLAAVVSQH